LVINLLHKNQIDYILGGRGWRSTIQSVKTRPDADCGSDHELLTATIRIKLEKT
jgi:endonuclease/exonuclease/phosphatase family metal-dependent hydrolase